MGRVIAVSLSIAAPARASRSESFPDKALERTSELIGADSDRTRSWSAGVLVRLAHAQALHATGSVDAAHDCIRLARQRLLDAASELKSNLRESFFAVSQNRLTLELADAWLS